MRKNLGGNRLGSGAKMDVELSGFGRSTHNLNTDRATTMTFGTLIPIHNSIVLAGDTREIDLDAMVLTHPTEGPLFGSAKLQVDVFKFDYRLYIAKLHMNKLETGLDMSAIKFPLIEMQASKIDWSKDPNNQQINPSSIFKYLGISGLGDTTNEDSPVRYFNGITWLAYWDIYKNYYANKQEKYGAVIHTGTGITETITSIQIDRAPTPIEIPEIPGTSAVTITYDDTIYVYFTGVVVPDWSTIKINTDLGEFSMSQMFDFYEEGTGAFRVSQANQNYQIINWRYATSIDPIATTPRVRTFELSKIDDIQMDILSKIKETSAYKITAESPEPFSLALKYTDGTYSKCTAKKD